MYMVHYTFLVFHRSQTLGCRQLLYAPRISPTATHSSHHCVYLYMVQGGLLLPRAACSSIQLGTFIYKREMRH